MASVWPLVAVAALTARRALVAVIGSAQAAPSTKVYDATVRRGHRRGGQLDSSVTVTSADEPCEHADTRLGELRTRSQAFTITAPRPSQGWPSGHRRNDLPGHTPASSGNLNHRAEVRSLTVRERDGRRAPDCAQRHGRCRRSSRTTSAARRATTSACNRGAGNLHTSDGVDGRHAGTVVVTSSPVDAVQQDGDRTAMQVDGRTTAAGSSDEPTRRRDASTSFSRMTRPSAGGGTDWCGTTAGPTVSRRCRHLRQSRR